MSNWRRRIQTLSSWLLGLPVGGIGLFLGTTHPIRAEDVVNHNAPRIAFAAQVCPRETPADTPEAPCLEPRVPLANLFSCPPQQVPADEGISSQEKLVLPGRSALVFPPVGKTDTEGAAEESKLIYMPFRAPPAAPVRKAAEDLRQLPAEASLPQVRLGGRILPIEREFSRWSWAGAPSCPERLAPLERIARQAEEHIHRAFDLAGRRAYFSARAEFITSLELLAQGLDQQHQTNRHRQALAQGLTALEEADDFLPGSAGVGAIRDLAVIITSHQTLVLHGTSPDTLTPMEALQRYFTYAQEQLALAAGGQPVGSRALHGLGKLYAALADQPALGLLSVTLILSPREVGKTSRFSDFPTMPRRHFPG